MALRLRRGTASDWATANPILQSGEPGVETDTGILKIGNGSTPWLSLAEVGKLPSYLAESNITAKYTKPAAGIPLGDLASNVQSSLSKADSAVQPTGLTRTAVGLANVDNTSDANKPVSTAQATAISAKYTKPSTGIPASDLTPAVQASLTKADSAVQASDLTKASVGLGNVDNTSDANKPVSTAQAAAISAKYTKPSSGIPLSDLATTGTASSSTFLRGDGSWTVFSGGSGGVAGVSSVAGRSGDVVLAKADVGLSNVDNTSDFAKPVSDAQAIAIDAKYTKPAFGVPVADLSPAVQASLSRADSAVQPSSLNKELVGLGNVDNTSDANKPVSSAQANAIAAKYTKPSTGIPLSDLASSGTPTSSTFLRGDGSWTAVATSSELAAKANIASPTFTGTPNAPTAVAGTSSTQIATTAFVMAAIQAALGNGGGTTTPPTNTYTDNGDGTITYSGSYTDNGNNTVTLPDGSYTDNGNGTITIG